MIQIQCKEKKIELPKGALGFDLAKELNLTSPSDGLGMVIDGVLLDLRTPLKDGDQVEILSFDSPKGKELFWHTSAHVLAQAILRLYPDAKPTIGPPIEEGFYYDFADLSLSEGDLKAIEKEAAKIIKEGLSPKRYEFKDKKEALERFKDNPYKLELIGEFEGLISGYEQGEFFDLCRGPHLPSLGKIKAFKLTKLSGAYFRGDQDREMLTRIYGISFPDRGMLKEYVTRIEEAKKRDHKVLGPKLDLFSFKEEGPGMPFIHPHGMIVWNELLSFLRGLQTQRGYDEIKTPQILNQELWERSGHWEFYQENMYSFDIEERSFAIKPMNCPGCMLFFKSKSHSYRNLPLRISEIGHVHRNEPSGALNGLLRVRSFHQDDSHIFVKPDDIKDEILAVIDLVDEIYSTFGLDYRFELSTRPKKSIGCDEDWNQATRGLKDALDAHKRPYQINEGDGAFYGPKIDIHIKDALGRSWQCGTVQLDFSLPQKFDLHYTDSDGSQKQPILIHRAIFGSIERFFAVLIEHFAGKFPLWISPRQTVLIPVAERHNEYAHKVAQKLKTHGLIAHVDDTNESVSKKVRLAQILQTNYMLTVGDQEVEADLVNVRRRDNLVMGPVSLDILIKTLQKEVKEKALTFYLEKDNAHCD